jgi:hypothetical protein
VVQEDSREPEVSYGPMTWECGILLLHYLPTNPDIFSEKPKLVVKFKVL